MLPIHPHFHTCPISLCTWLFLSAHRHQHLLIHLHAPGLHLHTPACTCSILLYAYLYLLHSCMYLIPVHMPWSACAPSTCTHVSTPLCMLKLVLPCTYIPPYAPLMMAGACFHLSHTCTYLFTSVVYMLPPPYTWHHLGTPARSPGLGSQGPTHMMQPSAQMSDWQECPFLETTSGARKLGVPQSTLGEVMGDSGRLDPLCQMRFTCVPPERLLRASLSPVAVAPWPHPGSQPQVPDLHLHVLVQEEVTCQMRGEAHVDG